MTAFERRQKLIEVLRKQPGLRVPELAALLNVSQGTIRNDLNALDRQGQVMRVHGGAALNDTVENQSPSFTRRLRKNQAAKQAIASQAAGQVEDGDAILLDASSTVLYLTQFLQNRSQLRVVTNGIEAARALSKNPTNSVILLGGSLNADGSAISGSLSEQYLESLHIHTAFLSCSGFSPEAGLTEVHVEEARLKIKMIQAAEQVIALVDSSKFGKVDLTAFVRVDQITHLYTDQNLSPEWIVRLQQTGPAFSVCGKEGVATFSPGSQPKRRYRVGFANQSERLPFAVEVRKGLERAAQEAGNVDLVLGDNQLKPDIALKVAEYFLTQNLDLVVEYQIDEQMGNRIMNLFQNAGIPVIAVDIPMIGATYFGVDNYRAGKMAGEALGRWVRDHWQSRFDRVILMEEPRAGALPATRMHSQMEGFHAVMGAVPDEKCLVLDSGNTLQVSERAMLAALKRLPDLHRLVVICFNDDVAIGALEAARMLGREEDVVIVGQGAEQRVRQELAKPGSRIIGSTAYSPEKYGDKLIPLALRILRGEPVPPAVYMEHEFIQAV